MPGFSPGPGITPGAPPGAPPGRAPNPGRAGNPGRAPGVKPGRPGAPPGPPGPPGKVRVGCIGRRAPGADEDIGREPGAPAACGRGRSKMGRPRCGVPGATGGA